MKKLKKAAAGVLTLALSFSIAGTSVAPTFADDTGKNLEELQKAVAKAQEEYDAAETAYDNGAVKFLESKMCDYHKSNFTVEKYEENIKKYTTGKNADLIQELMDKRDKFFTKEDGSPDVEKRKKFKQSWITFDNLKLQATWLDELNERRASDKNKQAFEEDGESYSNSPLKLNPELILDSMMSAMVSYYDQCENPPHILHKSNVSRTYTFSTECLDFNSDAPLEEWYDLELEDYNEGHRETDYVGHYQGCMKAHDYVGFGMYGFDDEFHIKHVSTAMRSGFSENWIPTRIEETGYTSEEWLKEVNEAEAPLKKNLDEAKTNLDTAKKALEEATNPEPENPKEDIAVHKAVLSASKYTYNGKTHTPSVKVYDQKGEMLSADQYTVKYSSGRKNLGSYTVDIYGKGDVTGTASAKYVIAPAKMKTPSVKAGKKKITIKWKKLGGGSQTYQIYVLKKGTKKAKYYTSTGSSKTIKKLSKKKYYYTKIRSYKKINGKTYYGSWSGTKKVKVK